MSPLTDRSQAKQGGFAQVRTALVKFEGTVSSAKFDQWGGKLVDDDGKPVPPREFLEIECAEVEVLEVTEELTMDITEWNFRVNCSDFEGSFWVEKFLESADKHKIQIPDELVGKRLIFEKVTLEAFDKNGTPNPKYDSTNYVIAGIKKNTAPVPKVVDSGASASPGEVEGTGDLMDSALALAVGKTEAQFRTAVGLDPQFAGSPLLSMAKAGVITQSFINEGKLELVKNGTKEVYQIPG